MIPMKIKDNVYSLRSNHWDRKMFDELVPLPEGTTYNSYLVRGAEKTALIDTAYPPKTASYIAALKAMGLQKVDYIVSNHAEQDHSGSIPAVLQMFPEAKVVTNPRCKGLIRDALAIDPRAFIDVKDGDRLSLGGKTLRFIYTPWVHWPETMATFLEEDRVVFPCDFLGSHLATTDLFAHDEARVEVAAKRYYAEIMMPYRPHCRNALERITALEPEVIAPSHGPVYDKPAFILDLYRQWTSNDVKPEVVIPYVSMYENTAAMVEYLTDRLVERGLPVRPFDVVAVDSGDLSMALVEASTVVFATPTVLGGPHPSIAQAAYLVNILLPKTRFAALIGSYGWGTTMPDVLGELLSQFKPKFFDPVLVKGAPREDDYRALDQLADAIAEANAALAAD